ncbi:hypothetical protein ABQ284_02145 [Lentilactobacillus buchneri]|uniref:hypothetical protein n=1 Tax=Lentilactobacillus buchneri TaxID=1581 RepID=UPI0030F146B9
MIFMLLMLFLVGYLVLNVSWLFIKASAWLIILAIGFLILSKLLVVGLIVAAVYGVYLLFQRSQIQPCKNRH